VFAGRRGGRRVVFSLSKSRESAAGSHCGRRQHGPPSVRPPSKQFGRSCGGHSFTGLEREQTGSEAIEKPRSFKGQPVARLVRDVGVAGSNPATPTINFLPNSIVYRFAQKSPCVNWDRNWDRNHRQKNLMLKWFARAVRAACSAHHHRRHPNDKGPTLSSEASLSNFKQTAWLRRKEIQDARHTYRIG
jgi:hypothetical protein